MTCSRAEARCILFDPTARNISTRGSVPITQPRPKLDARQEINEHMLLVGKLHPLLVHFPTVSATCSLCIKRPTPFRNLSRARDSVDMTVPIGTPIMSAISL
jgi:hypothetical protein